MKQIGYLIKKEFLQIFRTREMLAILFVVPVVQLAVLGFAITNEVKHIKLMVNDQDNSSLSREIVNGFRNTDRFDIVGYSESASQIESAIHSWNAQMGLVIPEHFYRDVHRGRQPELQLLIDGLDGNTAGVALGYAQNIVLGVARDNISSSALRQNIHLVEVADRTWYNLELRSAQYMVPGIVVVLLTIISLILSALSLVKEREVGTLEQLLVTPLKKQQLLLGKLTPFLILGFIELGIIMAAAQWIFNIQMQGSYLLLGGLSIIYLFSTLGLGIFVSTITNSQQQALFVAWFIMLLMIMLSGLFIPIANMPEILQDLTYLNPMRYFMNIIRDIFQKGSTIGFLLKDVIPMTLFGLLIFVFSVLNFQKRTA